MGAASISIQYGKQPDIENEWKSIIEIENVDERKKRIDLLLEKLEQNAEQNGFFGKEQEVRISKGNGVLFNDKEMYYQFFDTLRNFSELNKNEQFTEGAIIKKAIEETEKAYWGGWGTNKHTRLKKTRMEFTDDGDIQRPSISNLKGQNCSACVERAAMAHNLWLLTGKTSYYIVVQPEECNFDTTADDEYKGDAHAFSIVEYDGKYRLFDLSMDNICMLQGNPIEDIENGIPLKVEGPTVKNPGYYANYSKLGQENVN